MNNICTWIVKYKPCKTNNWGKKKTRDLKDTMTRGEWQMKFTVKQEVSCHSSCAANRKDQTFFVWPCACMCVRLCVCVCWGNLVKENLIFLVRKLARNSLSRSWRYWTQRVSFCRTLGKIPHHHTFWDGEGLILLGKNRTEIAVIEDDCLSPHAQQIMGQNRQSGEKDGDTDFPFQSQHD